MNMTSDLYATPEPPPAAYRYFKEKSFGRLVFAWQEDGREKTKSQDYTDLKDVDFDAFTGIILIFVRWHVTIQGSNLQKVCKNIDDKKICRLIQNHKPENKLEPDEPYISRIIWERLKDGM